MSKNKDDHPPIIIIKKIKKQEAGHHGGSWKVAYADFVTAMMAFFLLLWLLNVTTALQRDKIADYFSPQVIASESSGAGGVLGGTAIARKGAMSDSLENMEDGDGSMDDRITKEEIENDGEGKKNAALDKMDDKNFKSTENAVREAIEATPALKDAGKNLLIDTTPEGLRIQIVDQEGRPMFESGKAVPLPQTVQLLGVIGGIIKELPNKVSLRGHTDSKPYGKDAFYTNWELSADRANAARRILQSVGLDVTRLENVQGKSDREPLVPDDPTAARNRRVSILLLRQSIVKAAEAAKASAGTGVSAPGTGKPEKPQPKKREEGVIYFP